MKEIRFREVMNDPEGWAIERYATEQQSRLDELDNFEDVGCMWAEVQGLGNFRHRWEALFVPRPVRPATP
ncbi:MAG: hypothetical protein U0800_17785 [Isosphaeraceae bacterium]